MHVGIIHQLLGRMGTGYNVVGEDFREVGLVLRLDQRFNFASRQFGESFVGRSEDRERTLLFSVSTKPAALTAATSVVWSLELTAFSTMVLLGYMAAPPTITVSAAKLEPVLIHRRTRQADSNAFDRVHGASP